ncbi:HD domain-containing protein [Patescibacteria group bacterium]|nr:MAG: HD domain-containing protein [Patescibacteria group bacterium]
MIYTKKIKDAVKFSIKTHQVYQNQKRKGKDIPYITHPLTVGLILACAGAEEDVIVAGILHDTIEDSIPEKKVTKTMIAERFGDKVAELVLSVTEQNKALSWEERKAEALEHVKTFSNDSLLVKSADVLSNGLELIDDHAMDGDDVFSRFNAPKEKILKHYLELIRTIVECWPKNPLASELTYVASQLKMMGATSFMVEHRAKIIEYSEYKEDEVLECPVCHWRGTSEGNKEHHDDLFDVSCPICGKMVLVVSYPLIKNG